MGGFYKISTFLFFILFSYVELIDKTNYLNHYYFVSLISFLLIFLPANKAFSLDAILFKKAEQKETKRFYIFILQLQLFLVYLFAGIAKINTDWLLNAQPLKMWLPAFTHYPIIGSYMEKDWVAYLFCWFGCIYDLSIGFLLFNKKTVNVAFVFVLIFHIATALFFNIGMFPYIMITCTLIFMKENLLIKISMFLKKITKYKNRSIQTQVYSVIPKSLIPIFTVYFIIQILMPFRYVFYNGKLFWTEQGYRFSWRVMLMEKAGTAFFFIKDNKTGKEIEVDNKQYLNYMQEKQMATQPDMMVDYAKFLKKEFQNKGFENPIVHAQSYVTLNGEGSKEFIDATIDLSKESNSFFKNKNWIKKY
jgi:hypothetical protein